MEHYAGIDLHSTNSYIGIIDKDNKRIFKAKAKNNLPTILKRLEPFQEQLKGLVVESTYNWYWLVDGLMDKGYRVHLANPSAIKQYEGLMPSIWRTCCAWGLCLKAIFIPKQNVR